MARQYVTCKFNPWDHRTYTYHNDGPRLEPGAKVVVETARGQTEVIVETVDVPQPKFATKPIVAGWSLV